MSAVSSTIFDEAEHFPGPLWSNPFKGTFAVLHKTLEQWVSILAWKAITAEAGKNKVKWPYTSSNSLQHSVLFPWKKQAVHHISSLKDSSLDLNINWLIFRIPCLEKMENLMLQNLLVAIDQSFLMVLKQFKKCSWHVWESRTVAEADETAGWFLVMKWGSCLCYGG